MLLSSLTLMPFEVHIFNAVALHRQGILNVLCQSFHWLSFKIEGDTFFNCAAFDYPFLVQIGMVIKIIKEIFHREGEVSLKISCARKLYFALLSLMYNEFFIWKNVFLKIFQVFLMKMSPKTSNFVMLL